MAGRKGKKDTSDGEDAAGGSDKPVPTAAEAHLFYTIIKNMKSKPDIDWDAVAVDNNFKNADTAKVRFGQIKRKLGFEFGGGNNNGNTSSASGGGGTPKTPRGRGKKAGAAAAATFSGPGMGNLSLGDPGYDPIGAALAPTPDSGVKKSRGRRAARPKVEDFGADEIPSEVAVETPTKPKRKYTRKPKPAVKNEDLSFEDGINVGDDANGGGQNGGDDAMDLDDEGRQLGQITSRGGGAGSALKQEDGDDFEVEVLGAASAHVPRGDAAAPSTAFTAGLFLPVHKSTGSGYNPSASSDANSGGPNTPSGFPMNITFGGIREREPSVDDDVATVPVVVNEESTIASGSLFHGKEKKAGLATATATAARSSSQHRDDGASFNFASMMTSNMPGGGASAPSSNKTHGGRQQGGGGAHVHPDYATMARQGPGPVGHWDEGVYAGADVDHFHAGGPSLFGGDGHGHPASGGNANQGHHGHHYAHHSQHRVGGGGGGYGGPPAAH